MRFFSFSSSSWQKWFLLIVLLGSAASLISPVSASAATDLYDIGVNFQKSGRWDEALAAYNKAIELDPNYAVAWNSKGGLLFNLVRYDEALVAFKKVNELDPNYADGWENTGAAFSNLGRYEEAIVAFNKAIELDPNNVYKWNEKGLTLVKLGRYDEAIVAYNKVLVLDPQNAMVQKNKNDVLLKMSQGTTTFVTTPTTQAPTPVITTSKPTQIPSSQDSTSFNPLIIYVKILVVIMLLLCIGGGGYYILHSRKLPEDFTSERSDPAQSAQEPIREYDWEDLVLTRRKGQQLTLLVKAIEHLCDNANGQYHKGNMAEAEQLRVEAVREINRFKHLEEKFQHWKQAGYETSTLENLNGQTNLKFIHSRFKDYEERVSRLDKINWDLQFLNRQYPVEFKNPEIQKAVDLLKAQLKNPMRISDTDTRYALISKNIEEISHSNSQRDQRIQSQIQLLRGSIEKIKGLGIDPSTFFIKAKSQDSEHTENDLKEMAEAGYSAINNEMNRVQKEGIIVIRSTDQIRTLIDDKNYAGAIIASGKKMSEISALRETYSKAAHLKNKLGSSPVIELFKTGNYEQFLDEGEEILDLINQCTTLTAKAESLGTIPEKILKKFFELSKEQLLNTISTLKRFIQESEEINHSRLSARELFEKAEAFGKIPDGIPTNIDALDKQSLERIISDLEKYLKTAKPDLTFSMGTTQFVVNKWHKTKIFITNKGNANAFDINFIFSQEFDTKWIEEITVKAQGASDIEIGLLPKTEGNIPLEITAKYHDRHNKEYTSKNKFWIEVIDKLISNKDLGMTPAPGPVSHFTPKPTTPKQLPPDLSERYTESEFIGKGGFARVFKAKRNDGKYVAVKIPISMDAITGKSFIAEMQNWTKLSHPNIVRLYDFNIMPMPFFEEELCESALSDQTKPIESEEAAWILFNICEGLKFAHKQKILHRDLKPQNILLKEGVPKISDWGLSRIISESTTTTATSFTPHYAAPEQINSRVKDERTDIWQLGVILYELVTDVLPFKGDSMVEIGMNIATKDPKHPGEINLDAKVIDAVVMKCLEKDPGKRYQSVLELQKDLATYLRGNYTELLKTSITAKDYNQSAYYCGDLVLINLITGDLPTSYKYLLDLVHYSKGDVKVEAQELSEQIKLRMEMGVTEIPNELIQKAEIIVHQVSVGFRNRE